MNVTLLVVDFEMAETAIYVFSTVEKAETYFRRTMMPDVFGGPVFDTYQEAREWVHDNTEDSVWLEGETVDGWEEQEERK